MVAVAATSVVTDVVGYTEETMVLVLVGVGRFKQEQAMEMAVLSRLFRQSGVGVLDFFEHFLTVGDDSLVVVTA